MFNDVPGLPRHPATEQPHGCPTISVVLQPHRPHHTCRLTTSGVTTHEGPRLIRPSCREWSFALLGLVGRACRGNIGGVLGVI